MVASKMRFVHRRSRNLNLEYIVLENTKILNTPVHGAEPPVDEKPEPSIASIAKTSLIYYAEDQNASLKRNNILID